MRHWLWLLALIVSTSGCAAFEDMILGPPTPMYEGPVPTGGESCNRPPPNVEQSQEPPR